MFFKISLVSYFEESDPALDIEDKALDHWNQAKTINSGQVNEEKSFIKLEKCFHDEDPAKDCELINEHRTP